MIPSKGRIAALMGASRPRKTSYASRSRASRDGSGLLPVPRSLRQRSWPPDDVRDRLGGGHGPVTIRLPGRRTCWRGHSPMSASPSSTGLPVDAKTLSRQIRDFHRVCEDPAGDVGSAWRGIGGNAAGSHDVRDRGDRHLVVVPYGAAHALPFHALPWQGEVLDSQPTPCPTCPAPARFSSCAPGTAGVFRTGCWRLGIRRAWPIAGRSATRRSAAAPLPPAAIEAIAVAGLFPEGKALIGSEATKRGGA